MDLCKKHCWRPRIAAMGTMVLFDTIGLALFVLAGYLARRDGSLSHILIALLVSLVLCVLAWLGGFWLMTVIPLSGSAWSSEGGEGHFPAATDGGG